MSLEGIEFLRKTSLGSLRKGMMYSVYYNDLQTRSIARARSITRMDLTLG